MFDNRPYRGYAVPVIMFHSVGVSETDWCYNHLSETVELFEKKINYLLRKGYHFIFHKDLYQYMRGAASGRTKSIMLTFDDGFLDNWVIVYPILKKKGIRFTIYVSREFVDPGDTCRPTLDNVRAGKAKTSDLQLLGHLAWPEMREMQNSGLVDIQSHTATHTWHFCGEKIIDFYSPENACEYPWMSWNRNPRKKPYWAKEKYNRELLGMPIYENQRSMIARRYLPDESLNLHLREVVSKAGEESFFQQNGWRNRLRDHVNAYKDQYGLIGRFETDAENENRMRYELLENKQTIERCLDKEADFLCWPGGAYNRRLIELAETFGYRATTVKEGNNRIHDDYRKVNRISSGNPIGADRFPWKYPVFTLSYYIARFQNKPWVIFFDRLYRMKNMI